MSTSDTDRLLADLEALAAEDESLAAPPRTRARVMTRWDEQSTVGVKSLQWWNYAGVGVVVAAVIALVVAVGPTARVSRSTPIVAELVEGSLHHIVAGQRQPLGNGEAVSAGEVIHGGDTAGGLLGLTDGSRVEVRAQSLLALDRLSDGIRLRLDHGGIIVHAAKQSGGHLYVQTKDVRVSVVGTVFLVNAEKKGSRVAVIEGEVRVQGGAVEKTVRSGEQISTSPALEALPVREELAWSNRRQALGNLLLAASTRAQDVEQAGADAQTFQVLGGNPRFDVISVRPCEDSIDGNRGGPVNVSPGRFFSSCQTVMSYIEVAYRLFAEGRSNPYSYVRVVGGPDWIRGARYTISATAPDDASPALMRGPMLQALLETRFNLKVRRENRDIPVYSLTVAKGSPKLQPHQDGSCTPVVPPSGGPPARPQPGVLPCWPRSRWVGPHMKVEWRRATLQEIAWTLSLSVDRPVLDRTGLLGFFDASMEYTPDGPDPRLPPRPVTDQPATAPSFFTAVQEQLGLRLEATTGPGEFVVIDSVERPTEN